MSKKDTVLIVEDESISRRVLSSFLEKEGYRVFTVKNGREALELMKDRYFPLVITDWMMPELDGIELCKSIRKSKFPGYVFVIMLTIKSSKEDVIKGLNSGADDFLVKPVEQAELVARLNTGKRVLRLERNLKRVTDEVKILSITDSMTQTYNRAYLTEQLPVEIKRARRYKHPLSFLLLDIDHFKKINDEYGHLAGDHVLKSFVACLQLNIRKQIDWVARYGGEEFVVVLPETNIKGARALAERLRVAVSKLNIHTEGKDIGMTVSYGGASYDFGEVSISVDDFFHEKMLKFADDILYEAKNNGRNRGDVKVFIS